MKNQLIASLSFCLFSLAGWAQEPAQNLGSDRPGATFSASTVGQWVLQVQSGVDYTQIDHDLIEYANSNGQPLTFKYGEDQFNTATDLRFGLYKSFEIGISLISSNLTINENFNNEPISYASSLNPNLILVPSLRATAINNDNFQLGIMLAYDLTDYVADVFVSRIMASYAVNQALSLSANLSHQNEISSSGQDVYGYTLNLGYNFNKLTVFVENYGGLGVSKIDDDYETSFHYFFNAGAYYLLTENIQLDATLNFGYNQQEANMPSGLNSQNIGVQQAGAALGITWRFFAN